MICIFAWRGFTFCTIPCWVSYKLSSKWLAMKRNGTYLFSCRFLGVACLNLPYFPVWLDRFQTWFSCYCSFVSLCNRLNIAEYETYWFSNFQLWMHAQTKILQKNLTIKQSSLRKNCSFYKSSRGRSNKKCKTSVVTCMCRYSSGHLIPNLVGYM